jgi:GNAT superfamily N-acetyltransferase
MGEEWMPVVKLALTPEEFQQLPRHPAYRYEYKPGEARLSPRPKHYHAILELAPSGQPRLPGSLRQATSADLALLAPLFAAAFQSTQPYAGLVSETRHGAARQALERTVGGGDGPWIQEASFAAWDGAEPLGSIWITLLPHGDPGHWESYRWACPPPADCIQQRLGRPHLTWIFVSPDHARQGIGTALLAAATDQLLRLGFRELLTTFMSGNDSSMFWHWRNGFRLIANQPPYRREL